MKNLPEEISEVVNVDSFLISYLGTLGKAKFLKKIKPSIYRRHEGGTWSHSNREIQLRIKTHTLKKIANYHAKNDNPEIAQILSQKIKNYKKSLVLLYLRQGKFKKALRMIPPTF